MSESSTPLRGCSTSECYRFAGKFFNRARVSHTSEIAVEGVPFITMLKSAYHLTAFNGLFYVSGHMKLSLWL